MFQRLSAPGASALSIWELSGFQEDFHVFLGQSPCPDLDLPSLFTLRSANGASFDQGVLWLKEKLVCGPMDETENTLWLKAELHLHGGHGPASALRQRLEGLGWTSTDSTDTRGTELYRFLHARGHLNACAANARLEGPPVGLSSWNESLDSIPHSLLHLAKELQPFLGWAEVLQNPPKIALAGLPNSGKSSLFNAWLQSDRVTVSQHPGTTRDAVEVGILFGTDKGTWEARLIDTAGIWDAEETLDQAAIQESKNILKQAWKVIWVLDMGCPVEKNEYILRKYARSTDIILWNKDDFPIEKNQLALNLFDISCVVGSAKNDGMKLTRQLERVLIEDLGPIPSSDQWLPLLEEEREVIRRVLQDGTL